MVESESRKVEPVTSVTLGPHRYSVHFVEKCSKKNRVGEATVVTNTITVRDDQSASQLRSTMLHEILHHACWLAAARHADGWTHDLEEAFICAVEAPMLELFTRHENAALRDWLSA